MNAIIALCHFCETHGPSMIFCTQTLRGKTRECIEKHSTSNKICSACISLGHTIGLYSTDNDSEATFFSTQFPAIPDITALIRQATVRSLSCEVSHSKDGGFVFFGDSSRGHVLSHTFHVSDLQARGFYQLFSIVVLMKDKYFLLNIKPFLAEHLKKISLELQTLAEKVVHREETNGLSRQRCIPSTLVSEQASRSLQELTGEKGIYHILHSHFAWLLLAGSRFLTEHVTFGNLPWLTLQSFRDPQQLLAYNAATLSMVKKYEESVYNGGYEECFSLRYIKEIVREEFAAICFCALTGVTIIIRGAPECTFHFMLSLSMLLPEQMQNLILIDTQHQHCTNSDYRIISVPNDIAVPIASSKVLRIDFVNGDDLRKVSVKWPGELPSKWPQLLTKLIKAVDEPLFTESALNKQTKVLIEEWKTKVLCLNRAKSSSTISKLRNVLGVQSQDLPLIRYWSTHLQSPVRNII